MKFYSISLFIILFLSCACQSEKSNEQIKQSFSNELGLDFRPNILWLVAEDLSPFVPTHGDSTIETPTLSRLASEGVCYDNFYASAPVCSPARASIAMGMYPNHIGAGHMRTGPWYSGNIPDSLVKSGAKYFPEGIFPYEAMPPSGAKMMSEYLRELGYYTSNNVKEDYQFRKSPMAWDESSNKAHWRNRKPGQPFFSIFNFEVTHESRIWRKAQDSLWVPENLEISVPPYLPDTEIGRTDVRRMYSNIKEMDYQVGKILDQLEADGLLDSTIVFWYTDHGGPLPRHKRLLHDSGLKAPMIIRFPEKLRAGTRDDQMLSFIDLAPTILSLCGIALPSFFDGQAFLGESRASQPRQYIHAAADRFDDAYDANRAVRDKRFKYIKYYQPEKPMYLHAVYRDQMPIMQELHRLRAAGELTDIQAQWFREIKPPEELFDVDNDPYELNDLARDPAYKDKLEELRTECEKWVKDIDDTGLIEEKDLLAKLWPGMVQPVTSQPVIGIEDQMVRLSCETAGASLGYKLIVGGDEPASWTVYTKPFQVSSGGQVKAIAHRLGYKISPVVVLE